MGICMLPHPDLQTYDDILQMADRLMYDAKAAGKNRFRLLGNTASIEPAPKRQGQARA
jgi:PleD family two-component response regulator